MSEFQSAPGPWAGCNRVSHRGGQYSYLFQSLTQPLGRMQPYTCGGCAAPLQVSILTRPLGRMQLMALNFSRICSLFQSLTRPVGRMRCWCRCSGNTPNPGFNPHPACRPDATCRPARRTRSSPGFNPHPACRPDATALLLGVFCRLCQFQSSPGL